MWYITKSVIYVIKKISRISPLIVGDYKLPEFPAGQIILPFHRLYIEAAVQASNELIIIVGQQELPLNACQSVPQPDVI